MDPADRFYSAGGLCTPKNRKNRDQKNHRVLYVTKKNKKKQFISWIWAVFVWGFYAPHTPHPTGIVIFAERETSRPQTRDGPSIGHGSRAPGFCPNGWLALETFRVDPYEQMVHLRSFGDGLGGSALSAARAY